MERILQILGIGVITFVLIALISSMAEGCNSNKDADKKDQTEIVKDSISNEEVDMEEDIFDNEIADSDSDNASKDKSSSASDNSEESVDDFIDYTGDVKQTKKKSKNARKSQASKSTGTISHSTKRNTYSSNGSYLVVAGSYLVKDNALKMKRRIADLGYNSEIVNFDLSQYYSVLAGRFSSRSEAANVVEILKRSRIDSYIHRKKR